MEHSLMVYNDKQYVSNEYIKRRNRMEFSKEELVFMGKVFSMLTFKTDEIVEHAHAHNISNKLRKFLNPKPDVKPEVKKDESKTEEAE